MKSMHAYHFDLRSVADDNILQNLIILFKSRISYSDKTSIVVALTNNYMWSTD